MAQRKARKLNKPTGFVIELRALSLNYGPCHETKKFLKSTFLPVLAYSSVRKKTETSTPLRFLRYWVGSLA